MVRITSKIAGFRRCGIAHPAQPVDYPDDRFSTAQLAILKAEPKLVVQELANPEESPEETPGAEPKGGRSARSKE